MCSLGNFGNILLRAVVCTKLFLPLQGRLCAGNRLNITLDVPAVDLLGSFSAENLSNRKDAETCVALLLFSVQ